jgi:low affinity Fe/Cu permease
MGRPAVFIFAFVSIILWLTLGPYFQFSDTWELVINTVTSIITFLMVFLLQHTQNRDTSAMHLKLDEIIRSLSSSHNELLKAEELSDEELEKMIKVYEGLALTIKNKRKKGQSVDDCPEIDIENNKED